MAKNTARPPEAFAKASGDDSDEYGPNSTTPLEPGTWVNGVKVDDEAT